MKVFVTTGGLDFGTLLRVGLLRRSHWQEYGQGD